MNRYEQKEERKMIRRTSNREGNTVSILQLKDLIHCLRKTEFADQFIAKHPKRKK